MRRAKQYAKRNDLATASDASQGSWTERGLEVFSNATQNQTIESESGAPVVGTSTIKNNNEIGLAQNGEVLTSGEVAEIATAAVLVNPLLSDAKSISSAEAAPVLRKTIESLSISGSMYQQESSAHKAQLSKLCDENAKLRKAQATFEAASKAQAALYLASNKMQADSLEQLEEAVNR